MMICASLMALASIGIFFVNLEIRLMLTCVFFSNMTYLWSIIFVLGKSMADPRLNKKFDASFARLKTGFIFSGFFSIFLLVINFKFWASYRLLHSYLALKKVHLVALVTMRMLYHISLMPSMVSLLWLSLSSCSRNYAVSEIRR